MNKCDTESSTVLLSLDCNEIKGSFLWVYFERERNRLFLNALQMKLLLLHTLPTMNSWLVVWCMNLIMYACVCDKTREFLSVNYEMKGDLPSLLLVPNVMCRETEGCFLWFVYKYVYFKAAFGLVRLNGSFFNNENMSAWKLILIVQSCIGC